MDAKSRARSTQEASKCATTKDGNGKPVVFPNQEIYSEIARKRKKNSVSKVKSPPQAIEALAAKMVIPFYNNWREEQAERARRAAASAISTHKKEATEDPAKMVVPFYNNWREDQAERARRAASAISTHNKGAVAASISAAAPAAPSPSSTWNPPLSVRKAKQGFLYQDQEESLMIQHRLLRMERSVMQEQKQKQLQRYLQQQQQQSRTQDVSSEQISSKLLMQQHQKHTYDNTKLRVVARQTQMAHHQEPTLLPQDDPNVQVRLSLLELENQVRAEEHDRILQTNQREMSELHQHAIQLEEQMKLREMDFLKERRRVVDMQTVNRLRLQADELEKVLMR